MGDRVRHEGELGHLAFQLLVILERPAQEQVLGQQGRHGAVLGAGHLLLLQPALAPFRVRAIAREVHVRDRLRDVVEL